MIWFENYLGLENMVHLAPQMAAGMRQAHTPTTNPQPRTIWMNSKAQTPEMHEANKLAKLCYNAWFGTEMEPVGEDSDAAVGDIYDVLEGKGANGTKIAAYLRPGSKGPPRTASRSHSKRKQWGQATSAASQSSWSTWTQIFWRPR